MKLETIKSKLESAGIKTEYKFLVGYDKPVRILSCDTDYEGMYPTKDTYNKIETIRNIAKNNKCECRGYYTAMFIYE